MNKTIKGFAAVFIAAILVSTTTFAAPVMKNINIAYENIKIYMDGTLLKPVDVNGKSVEPFIYNSTAYLPVRAVAQAFGKSIEWDSNTKAIYLGDKKTSGDPHPPVSSASPEIDGLSIFPSDNFWNTPVDKLPVHPSSSDYIASIGKSKTLHPDFGTVWYGQPIGIPYNVVEANQPKVNVTFDYADESDPGPYPIPQKPLIEGGSDKHLLILQKGSNILYELFNVEKNSNGSWHAGSGAIWHLDKNEARPKGWTSADASGLAILPGLVRYEEVYEESEINHAIRITVSKIQKAYIPPASHTGGKYTAKIYPPMGLRLRLKDNFNILSFDKNVQVILKAFKKYGVVIADVGSDMYVTGVPDSRWDDEILRALGKVSADNFEAVYTGDAIPY